MNILETIVTLILIGLLIVFLNPTHLLMPETVGMMLMLLLIVVFLTFASLFWKEKAADEREHLHILNAGRISFLIGSTVLTLGILIQSMSHEIDPWLIYALISMILAKALTRIYSQHKQ